MAANISLGLSEYNTKNALTIQAIFPWMLKGNDYFACERRDTYSNLDKAGQKNKLVLL